MATSAIPENYTSLTDVTGAAQFPGPGHGGSCWIDQSQLYGLRTDAILPFEPALRSEWRALRGRRSTRSDHQRPVRRLAQSLRPDRLRRSARPRALIAL